MTIEEQQHFQGSHEPHVKRAARTAEAISRKGILGRLAPAEVLLDVLFIERSLNSIRQLSDKQLVAFYQASFKRLSSAETSGRASAWALEVALVAAVMAERESRANGAAP